MGPYETTSTGNRYVLLVVDTFTGYVELTPLAAVTATAVTTALDAVLVYRYGAPEHLQVDNASYFKAGVTDAWRKRHGVPLTESLTHNPESKGFVERAVASVKKGIKTMTGNKLLTWDKHLPAIQFGFNSAVNRSTGMSPFEALFGRTPATPASRALGISTPVATYEDVRLFTAMARARVREARAVAGLASKLQYDSKSKPLVLKAGDYVLVHDESPEGKLSPHARAGRVVGPTRVADVYWVDHFEARDERQRVHVRRLCKLDMSRATEDDLTLFRLPDGWLFVAEVDGHREREDGVTEYRVRLEGEEPQWRDLETSPELRRSPKLQAYCVAQCIAAP